MRKFTKYVVIWETITRDGYSYRHYQRTFDSLEAAERCYFSKRRTQFARLFKKESTEIRPAYQDENGVYYAAFFHNDITLIRENGK